MEGHDFSGYATKAGLKCKDGRVITPEAFQHMDGKRVPLVWQHGHNDVGNVLGHAILKAVPDGIRAYGFFNPSPEGQKGKVLVQHGDIVAMSIYANDLKEKVEYGLKQVLHGVIREVSLVLSGANPGALIDFVRIVHGDEYEELDDTAIIHTGEPIRRGEEKWDDEVEEKKEEVVSDDKVEHAAGEDMTIQDVVDSMTPEQRDVTAYLVAKALENNPSVEQSGLDDTEDNTTTKAEGDDLEHQEGKGDMAPTRNVFDQNDTKIDGAELRHDVTRDEVKDIVQSAIKKGSFKQALQDWAELKHGITDIDLLFPDAKTVFDTPEFDKRRTEWVAGVLDGTRKSPFSRVKTLVADLTQDEARAKGYITGEFKKEEWIGLTRRTTSPTTIYKKQRLDRDDMLDITELNTVVWLKGEMRLMIEEELARAILIGDGRDPGDQDKVKDPVGQADGVGIRSIANDSELFATTVYVNVDDANSSYMEVVDGITDAMEHYKGTGTPTMYCTIKTLNLFYKMRDTTGRRIYQNKAEVAQALGVRDIVTVDVMNDEPDIVSIIVNLTDYNIGTDAGGQLSMFDDFDIDYNQHKYLIETRLSGALVKIKSAVVVRKTTGTDVLATPTVPTFVESTGVVTIPSVTGVVYKNATTDATLSAGAQSALSAGNSIKVKAVPASGYYFTDTVVDGPWTFKRPSA